MSPITRYLPSLLLASMALPAALGAQIPVSSSGDLSIGPEASSTSIQDDLPTSVASDAAPLDPQVSLSELPASTPTSASGATQSEPQATLLDAQATLSSPETTSSQAEAPFSATQATQSSPQTTASSPNARSTQPANSASVATVPNVADPTSHRCSGVTAEHSNVLCFPLGDQPEDSWLQLTLSDDIVPTGLCDPARAFDILMQMNGACALGNNMACDTQLSYKCDYVDDHTGSIQPKSGVQTCQMSVSSKMSARMENVESVNAIKLLGEAVYFSLGQNAPGPNGSTLPGYGSQHELLRHLRSSFNVTTYQVPKTVEIEQWFAGEHGDGQGSIMTWGMECYKPKPSTFDTCGFILGLVGAFVPFVGPAFAAAGKVLSDATKAAISAVPAAGGQLCKL